MAALALAGCAAPPPGTGATAGAWSEAAPGARGWRDGAGPTASEDRTRGLWGSADGVEARTSAIVDRLNRVWQDCARTSPVYRIDCLSEGYVRAAGVVPQDDLFGEARAAILQSAARLDALAAANRSQALPAIAGAGRSRPLRAIDPARLAAANAAATRIIAETETVLLRASQSSLNRRVPFQQIAQAVGSSKTLLRS